MYFNENVLLQNKPIFVEGGVEEMNEVIRRIFAFIVCIFGPQRGKIHVWKTVNHSSFCLISCVFLINILHRSSEFTPHLDLMQLMELAPPNSQLSTSRAHKQTLHNLHSAMPWPCITYSIQPASAAAGWVSFLSATASRLTPASRKECSAEIPP